MIQIEEESAAAVDAIEAELAAFAAPTAEAAGEAGGGKRGRGRRGAGKDKEVAAAVTGGAEGGAGAAQARAPAAKELASARAKEEVGRYRGDIREM